MYARTYIHTHSSSHTHPHALTYAYIQFVEALKEGRVLEAFGAGTAAVVSPIKVINYQDVVSEEGIHGGDVGESKVEG